MRSCVSVIVMLGSLVEIMSWHFYERGSVMTINLYPTNQRQALVVSSDIIHMDMRFVSSVAKIICPQTEMRSETEKQFN